MKKLSLVIAVLLAMLCLSFPALAEEDVYVFGDGATDIGVIVTVASEPDTRFRFVINTDQDNLMDAVVESGLVEVEKASWGYYVTTVLEVEAEGDSYWSIVEYDGNGFVKLEEPIERKAIKSGDVYAFILF